MSRNWRTPSLSKTKGEDKGLQRVMFRKLKEMQMELEELDVAVAEGIPLSDDYRESLKMRVLVLQDELKISVGGEVG